MEKLTETNKGNINQQYQSIKCISNFAGWNIKTWSSTGAAVKTHCDDAKRNQQAKSRVLIGRALNCTSGEKDNRRGSAPSTLA